MDGREDQFDRPFGRQPLRLQRIGQTQAADDQIGPRRARAIQLPVDILPLADPGFRRQTLIVGLVYGGVLGAVGGLLVLGKLLGSPSLALPARELIDNVLSPLPVLLLLAALRLAPR